MNNELWFNKPPGGGGGGGYAIERSLRFNSSDGAYCNWNPASAGNQKTWTISVWIKRSSLSGSNHIVGVPGTTDSTYFEAWFTSTGSLSISGYLSYWLKSVPVYRDPSAWYHLLISVDTTQAIASDRFKVYMNGDLLVGGYTVSPSLNSDLGWNRAAEHRIGRGAANTYGNHYLADFHSIDGQALDPTSFGEFDSNGIWQPIAYSGSYGTNGFHLPFSDNSTAAALGTDTSGNGNTWTVNNISVAAGAGNDSLVDVPTNGTETDTGVGGEVRGNYCTLNPLQQGPLLSTSDGLLKVTSSASNTYNSVFGTIGMSSGKWYWEQTLEAFMGADIQLGIGNKDTPLNSYPGSTPRSYGFSSNDTKWNNTSQPGYTTSWVAGDVIGLAFDADAGTLTLYKNGSSLGVAFSSIPADTYFPIAGAYSVNSTSSLNFGQRPFAYPAPSGFKALNTANLPTPTIADGSTAMDVVTYTGNSGTQTISGLEFSPDLVWAKVRNTTGNHSLYDIVRGTTKRLSSSTTSAEATFTSSLTSFDSGGFSLGSNPDGDVNSSGNTYVAWAWDAGSSTVTNTDGSITSSVRANPSAGFSIVTYSGTGSAGATVGHGLGVAPAFVIAKSRTNLSEWACYHQSLGNGQAITLHITAAASSSSTWNSTSPTSSVVTLGVSGAANASGYTHVMYCFAPVSGYSSFGSYAGNGSTDGPFVYTGFRPRWVLVKCSSTLGSSWQVLDTARGSYNRVDSILPPNDSSGELTYAGIDFLSNGFKLRSTSSNLNGTQTYIYAAFAEYPFQYARAR